jgi:hypothetical protein
MTRVTIDDRFDGPVLDTERWVPHYLPQWTTPDRSAARYDLAPEGLRLRIDADQPAWREADGPMRVSNLQTATFSGPLGSAVGTHRHRPDGLVVATEQPTRVLWAEAAGEVEVRASASTDPRCMLGLWLVGTEVSGPQDAGELCLAELFGDLRSPGRSTVRLGVKAHHDPRLVDDVEDVVLGIDTAEPHTYAVRWHDDEVTFLVDGAVVKTCRQRLGYDLQLMVSLFEFPDDAPRDPSAYPRTALVHEVHARPHPARSA